MNDQSEVLRANTSTVDGDSLEYKIKFKKGESFAFKVVSNSSIEDLPTRNYFVDYYFYFELVCLLSVVLLVVCSPIFLSFFEKIEKKIGF